MFPMKSYCIGPSSFLIRSPKSIRVAIEGKSRLIEVSKVGIGPTESNWFSLARSTTFQSNGSLSNQEGSMNNGRIWKTGVLAVIATLAFASFVFRIEEWTKGLRSHFLVLGQTGTPPGGKAITKIIPQIAVGSFDGNVTSYRTVTEIVNTGSSTVSVTGNFYNPNGSTSTLTFTTNLTAIPTFSGTLAPTNLSAN